MTAKEQGLPKLPKPYLAAGDEYIGNYSRYNLYTEHQAEAYALAALASDTGERGVVAAAGTKLSNIAYNLAQRSHLTDHERNSLNDARKEWDAALNKQQEKK